MRREDHATWADAHDPGSEGRVPTMDVCDVVGPGAPAEVVPEPRCHSSVRRAQREAEAPHDHAVEHGDAGNPAAGVLGQHLHLRAATGESSGETGDMPFEAAGAREEA